MTTATSMPPQRLFGIVPIPQAAELPWLLGGGAIGLFVWELWARLLTPAVLGYPLEPAGLIDALLQHNFGIGINRWLREGLHYAIGIVGYPVAYYVISRTLPRWPVILDAIVLATFTAGTLAYWHAGKGTSLMFIFYTVVLALILSRRLNKDPAIAAALTWGNFTWFNALGIMAPLGGLSFYLLGEGGELSYMSFVGHVIYGAIAAWVFETMSSRTTAMA
jgi:hypothetical protein